MRPYKEIWIDAVEYYAGEHRKADTVQDMPLSARFEQMTREVGEEFALSLMRLGISRDSRGKLEKGEFEKKKEELGRVDASFDYLAEGKVSPDTVARALVGGVADFFIEGLDDDSYTDISNDIVRKWLRKCLAAGASPEALIKRANEYITGKRLAWDGSKDQYGPLHVGNARVLNMMIEIASRWRDAHPVQAAGAPSQNGQS